MIIYLRHPEHGTKVATLEEEAIFDESNGWLRYDPATGLTPAAPNELVARRRGRKPLNEGRPDDGDDGRGLN